MQGPSQGGSWPAAVCGRARARRRVGARRQRRLPHIYIPHIPYTQYCCRRRDAAVWCARVARDCPLATSCRQHVHWHWHSATRAIARVCTQDSGKSSRSLQPCAHARAAHWQLQLRPRCAARLCASCCPGSVHKWCQPAAQCSTARRIQVPRENALPLVPACTACHWHMALHAAPAGLLLGAPWALSGVPCALQRPCC